MMELSRKQIKKRWVLLLAAVVIGVSLSPAIANAAGITIIVSDFGELQERVNEANEGDTIDLSPLEGKANNGDAIIVKVTKSLTFVGKNTSNNSIHAIDGVRFEIEDGVTVHFNDLYLRNNKNPNSIIFGEGNVVASNLVVFYWYNEFPVSFMDYPAAIDMDGDVTISGELVEIGPGVVYPSSAITGCTVRASSEDGKYGTAGTGIRATGTVTVSGSADVRGGDTYYPGCVGGRGIEAHDVNIVGELRLSGGDFFDSTHIEGGSALTDSGQPFSGKYGGHAIVATGDVTFNGGSALGGSSSIKDEDKDNENVVGGIGILAEGNITLDGEKRINDLTGETFFSCWIRSGRGAYVAGVPIKMAGNRAKDEFKTLTATNAMIRNNNKGKYASSWDVEMEDNDIAILDGCYIGWYNDIPLFSGGQVSIRNPFAVWGTLENVRSYIINYARELVAAMNEAHYTPASWTALQTALGNVPDSFYESGDETDGTTLKAAISRMNILEDSVVEAYDGLVIADADYTEVNQAIAKIPADLSIYTDETVAAVNLAKDSIDRTKKATEQDKVNDMAKAIENAIKALVKKDADYSAVDAAIAKIPSDLNIYTEATANAVTAAKDAVIRGKNITEQSTVDGWASAIENAVKALVKKTSEVPDTEEKPDYVVDSVTGIKVEYEDGSKFDNNVTLRITTKSKNEMNQFKNVVDKAAKGLTLAGMYDIKLMKDDVAIQPVGKVKISIPLTDEMKAMSDWKMIYIDNNGNATVIPSQIIDGKIIFTTDHFSYYGVIGKVKTDSSPSKTPQTGDSSNIVIWFTLGIGTLTIITIIIVQAIVVKKRRCR